MWNVTFGSVPATKEQAECVLITVPMNSQDVLVLLYIILHNITPEKSFFGSVFSS